MRNLPTVQEFYLEYSLYDKFSFSKESAMDVYHILYTLSTIDMQCIACNEHSIFKPVDNRPIIRSRSYTPEEWAYDLDEIIKIISKTFICSRNNEHKAHFFIKLDGLSLKKIGQEPSLADLTTTDIKQYKKILGNEFFAEFNKAVGLYSHGVGVGSFVYLRRIIENFIIKPAYEASKSKHGWDEEIFIKSRFKERVELLKAELPVFLINNSTLYSIISKGIHELTEKECLEYFPVLKACIVFILNELEAKRQAEVKRQELAKSLGAINQKIEK